MADLVTLIDVTGAITYIGEAWPSPGLAQSSTVWKILRISTAVSGSTFLWADGNPTYTKAWTDRATFTYAVS